MTKEIKVGIAEDQVLFRKGIVSILNGFDTIDVIVEADNGRILLDQLKTIANLPHVLLLDLKMPELDGIETTKIIRETYPDIKIIILTSYNEKRFILHLLECGAHAYLLKDAEPEDLKKAIAAVANEGYYFTPAIMEVIINNKKEKKDNVSLEQSEQLLSEREIEVIRLICKEKTAPEIGELLFISPRTVEGHRNRILEKTGCKNVAGLVVYAFKNNLVEPTP
ncbi:MAG: response regulator [Crocinitomix sp.]|nr:response regulator [Crocinitomix sp.]